MAEKKAGSKIKVSFGQALGLLGPYVRQRFMDQVKAVWLIILYLIVFQTVVLGIPIADASVIAVGLSLVVFGLTFFMEGLLLGLMPLGEVIGVKLPQKSPVFVILIFAFMVGMGATYAEPAIGVLKQAGSAVTPWNAPLLFLLLNKHAGTLVLGVGMGVGIAVLFGVLRFLYNWSLKPFIYTLISGLLIVSVWGYFDPNMLHLTGLAWDCGAVTTGPVTVPLVLALGIGISRVVDSGDSDSAGFGVVTLASLFPIITVMGLGIFFLGSVPAPAPAAQFLNAENRTQAVGLFESEEHMQAYALKNSYFNLEGSPEQPIQAVFDGDAQQVEAFITRLKDDAALTTSVMGSSDSLERWAARQGNEAQRLLVFGTPAAVTAAATTYAGSSAKPKGVVELLTGNFQLAVQAILPLTLFLILVLVLIIRERLPRPDEIMLGIVFAMLGMGIFNIGIELGLTKLGNQVGGKLPASFTSIALPERTRTINNFDETVVKTAVTEEGQQEDFFYIKDGNNYQEIPFEDSNYDGSTKQYNYTPTIGPLFGRDKGLTGILVVLLFAFIMGYGATLAEPALNALGLTVEEITVGTFKKSLLMQAVAIGVGVGIMLGVAKIIWNIPLVFLLAPPYILLLFISWASTEEFVNIGWDSAGVTTGPITVPLVLAMGLGIGGQIGVVEGFGILSMASVCPILSVLLVGMSVTRKRKAALASAAGENQAQQVAA
ncbi:MAG: DUF1538 domain-containing protein [bacterium]|nr:DUF1538 domain-containing protein [bacterium]